MPLSGALPVVFSGIVALESVILNVLSLFEAVDKF